MRWSTGIYEGLGQLPNLLLRDMSWLYQVDNFMQEQ